MVNLKKKHIILIAVAILIIATSIGVTAYLLFSNYQNVLLFKQAKANFLQGDPESLKVAELQLQQVIRNDKDNEVAYIMLGEIAGKQKIYPEQVYYSYMAYMLNQLSKENKEKYISSLCLARHFDRLENFLFLSNPLLLQISYNTKPTCSPLMCANFCILLKLMIPLIPKKKRKPALLSCFSLGKGIFDYL